MLKHPKRPRDPAQLARMIVELATGEIIEPQTETPDPSKEFARKGGLKGGKARASALTPSRRSEIARLAAEKRWAKKQQ